MQTKKMKMRYEHCDLDRFAPSCPPCEDRPFVPVPPGPRKPAEPTLGTRFSKKPDQS